MSGKSRRSNVNVEAGEVKSFEWYGDTENDEEPRWSIESYFDIIAKELAPLLDKMPKTIKLLGESGADGVTIWSEPRGSGRYEVRIEAWDNRGSIGQTFDVSFKQ